jgi:mannose-6-phosphate isomerase-like protein (cupin superfamily)
MDRTPPPVSLAAALALPRTQGRSAEVFIDSDLELRFSARPTNGPQVPHQRDELYFVAAGTGHYRVDDKVNPGQRGRRAVLRRSCGTRI